MKKLLAVLLLAASPLVAQDSSVNKDGSNAGGGGSSSVDDLTDLGAGVADWLKTASCANFATAVSGETGTCGSIVLSGNPNFTLLRVNNAATGAGCIGFIEDSDNGSNVLTLCGPASTADATVTLGSTAGTVAITGTNSWADGITQTFNPDATNSGLNLGSVAGAPSSADPGDMWYDSTERNPRAQVYGGAGYAINGGRKYARLDEEFICGEVDGAPNTEKSCAANRFVITGGGTSDASPATTGVGTDHPGVVGCLIDVTADQCAWGSGNSSAAVLTDGMRWQTGVMFSHVADAAGDVFEVTIGGSDASSTASDGDATDGVFVTARSTDGTDTWTMNVFDGGTGTSAACTNAGDIQAATWYNWDFYYESGVGVHFILNGTECTNSPINADLPTATGESFRPIFYKCDAISSTDLDVSCYIDYFIWSVPLPTR